MTRRVMDHRWRRFRDWLSAYEASVKRFDKVGDETYYRGMQDAIDAITDTAKEMQRDKEEP